MRDEVTTSATLQCTETEYVIEPLPASAAATTSAAPSRHIAALLGGAGATLVAAYAVYRGVKSRREEHPGDGGITHVETSITVDRPRRELYGFWRRLENLPRFMKHLESVQELGDGRSHWVARSPVGARVAWDAEVVEDREGQLLSWRSTPGSRVHNAGYVLFEDAPGGRGTVVRVGMDLLPPGGAAGKLAARALSGATSHQVHADLRRFKSLMEAGEVPTIDGQPAGHRGALDLHNPL